MFITRNAKIAKRQLIILACDFFILIFAPLLSAHLYYLDMPEANFSLIYFNKHPYFFALYVIVMLIILYIFDLYCFQQDFRKPMVLYKVFLAVLLGAIFNIVLSYILNMSLANKNMLCLYYIIIFMSISLLRIFYSVIGSSGMYDKKTLVVGFGESGRNIVKLIHKTPNSGINVIAFLTKKPEKNGIVFDGVSVVWQKDSLIKAVKQFQPHLLIIAMNRKNYYNLSHEIIWCAQQGIEIWDAPNAFEHLEQRVPLRYIDETWLLFTALNQPKLHLYRVKRIMDILVAVIGLIFSSLIMIVIAVAIKIESNGPVVFVQKRVGKKGRIFNLYKFRSMYSCNPLPGEKGTCKSDDNRITHVGRIIRKLHLDELPQLINVIKGDLSMIGPRAELLDFVHDYIGVKIEDAGCWDEEGYCAYLASIQSNPASPLSLNTQDKISQIIPYIEQRFTVQQGITGWAQVMHPHVSSIYEDMVKKLEYDLYYIKNMSFTLDIIILLKTIKVVLCGNGK